MRDPRGTLLAWLCVAGLWASGPVRADDLLPTLTAALPADAVETARVTDPESRHGVPVGPAGPATAPPMQAQSGLRHRVAFAWEGDDADAVQAAVLDALDAAGFDTLHICQTDDCGGFDFRLALPVLPLPDMAVNLASFRHVAARRTTPPALVGLLVSATPDRTHAQLTLVTPAPQAPPANQPAPPTAAQIPEATGGSDLAARLDSAGRAVLDGLDFAPGSTALAPHDGSTLAALAAWLAADPARRIALVGHTDWTGTPEANLAVSRARAAAVAAALEAAGADPGQITVAGVGPFAPRAANTTPEGLAANRRVEAVRLKPD